MEATRISPPSFPVVTTAELEAWLRLDPNTDTSTLDMLVTSATEIVEGITNRTIAPANYRVTTDNRATCYALPLTNVTVIISVTVAGEPVTDWLLTGDTLHLPALPASPPVITLRAGYPDIDLIPDAIRHAIAVLVSAGYNAREDIDAKTFQTVERLCARYRRIVL